MAAGLTLSENLLKSIFFALNFGLWAGGLMIIAATTFSLGGWQQLRTLDLTLSYKTSLLLFTTGLFLSLLGGVGCFGSFNNSSRLFYAYSLVLFIMFAVEVSSIIYMNKHQQTSSELIARVLDRNMLAYLSDRPTKETWDYLQTRFNCCGGSNYSSWYQVLQNQTVPKTCCLTPDDNRCPSQLPRGIYEKGCADTLRDFIEERTLLLTLVATIVALAQWLCIVTSWCLGNAIHDRNPANYRRLYEH
ncbi:tetraspanin-4-like [Convolutriloba macropyga]|uniref:tetraspanin-4-like n=1 Tax=Convolutriloba macropyga TaxID=536237 RepID=UPI003F523447